MAARRDIYFDSSRPYGPLGDDDVCPFVQFNDLSLALCLSTYNIPMVHSDRMHCMPTFNLAYRN